jgi:VanZ family protein
VRRLLALAILLLIYVCLYPWHFNYDPGRLFLEPLSVAAILSDKKDFILNCWVYIPLGALLFWSFPSWKRLRWFVPLVAGFSLSLLVEMVQFYIPSRVSSQNDILANTLGSVTGGLAAAVWKSGTGISRWLPRASIETFLLLVWMAFLLQPMVPVHGPTRLLLNVSELRASGFSISDTTLWAATWIMVWHLIPGAAPPATNRWLVFGAMLLAIPGRLFLVSRVLTKAEVAGAAAGLLCVLVFPGKGGASVRLGILMMAAILIRGLAPFQFSPHAADFQWIPFETVLRMSDWQPAMLVVAEKLFWYGSIVWAVGRGGLGWPFAAAIAAGWLASIEAIQVFVPAHVPEITDPLIAVVCAIGFGLAERTSTERTPLATQEALPRPGS